jgi:hypothetical protein
MLINKTVVQASLQYIKILKYLFLKKLVATSYLIYYLVYYTNFISYKIHPMYKKN